MFSNPPGSLSAMSLAANPLALPVIATAAGVAVTVAAATMIYSEYKEYEEKKHREAIEAINHLHDQFLKRIFVLDLGEIQGLPQIYKLSPDQNAHTADSLHYTDEEVDAIGKTFPRGTDIALSGYRESIINAILKLKEYYFSRKDRRDITAGVISYLLNMLETKCLNFCGYDYDIAYLHALSNFVNAYASMQDSENTQHFSRLNPVYSYMLTAKQALERHKESLSLEEIIGELRDACIFESNLLIRNFVKMVTCNDNWDLVKTVAQDELAQGILRKRYIRSSVFGHALRNYSEIETSESIFQHWVAMLSTYYLQTLDTDSHIFKKEILAPEKIFIYPNLDRINQLNKNKMHLSESESKELKKLESDLSQIKSVFLTSENFITTKLDPKSKHSQPTFMQISNDHDVIARTKVFAGFASLIHEIISLQYLCTQMIKSIKQLGEIYVKNPNHFCHIFNILNGLCQRIKDDIISMKKIFTEIQQANRNYMQLQEKELFPEEIKKILDTTLASISKLSARVKDYRDKVAKHLDPNEETIESVKNQMFKVAKRMAVMYSISSQPTKTEDPASMLASNLRLFTPETKKESTSTNNMVEIISTAPAKT